MSARVNWVGDDAVLRNMDLYVQKVMWAIRQVATLYSGIMETYAKDHAPWGDVTGNARQALYAGVEELANDTVRLYLSHGVFYGLFLEVRFAGRYSVIWPTIETYLPQIRQSLQEIFG